MHCAPIQEAGFKKTKTCFSKASLVAMTQAVGKDTVAIKSKSKGALWKRLNAHFMETCKGDEQCWVDTDIVKKSGAVNIVEKDLRPKMPNEWLMNNKSWLTNFDIQDVMKQYERKYHTYKFLGVFSIDFAASNGIGGCVANVMCQINVAQLITNGIKQVGIVLNLDRRDQAGSHWVALYANFDVKAARGRYGIFYYDSNSTPPPKEVVAFQQKIQQQVSVINKKRTFGAHYNTQRHQYGNSECGVFVMYFIERMLKGATFESIMKATEYDQSMNRLRFVYFRNATTPK
jgi:hypothetical protein